MVSSPTNFASATESTFGVLVATSRVPFFFRLLLEDELLLSDELEDVEEFEETERDIEVVEGEYDDSEVERFDVCFIAWESKLRVCS